MGVMGGMYYAYTVVSTVGPVLAMHVLYQLSKGVSLEAAFLFTNPWVVLTAVALAYALSQNLRRWATLAIVTLCVVCTGLPVNPHNDTPEAYTFFDLCVGRPAQSNLSEIRKFAKEGTDTLRQTYSIGFVLGQRTINPARCRPRRIETRGAAPHTFAPIQQEVSMLTRGTQPLYLKGDLSWPALTSGIVERALGKRLLVSA